MLGVDNNSTRLTATFHDDPLKPVPECLHLGFLLELRMMEVVSGDNWNWTCKSLQSSSQIVTTNQQTDTQRFTGRMPFLSHHH